MPGTGTLTAGGGDLRATSAFLRGLRRRRRAVVEAVLWVLLAVIAATFALNAAMLGRQVLSVQAAGPNLVFAAVVGAALWQNRKGRLRVALGAVVVLILAASTVPLLVVGLSGNEVALFLFFVPVVLAGMLTERAWLFVAAGWSVAAVLVAAVTQVPGASPPAVPASTVALQFALVLAIVTFFADRGGAALQAALAEASAREAELTAEVERRVRIEKALRDEVDFTAAVMDGLPGVFYVLDPEGGYFRWNRNFERVLGYGPDEIRGLGPMDLFEGDARDEVRRRIEEALTSGRATAQTTLVTKDGERVPYLITGTRVQREEGTFLAGMGIDRSEIETAQTRIERLNAQLEERLERITALRAIDRAITASLDLEVTMDVVLDQVTRLLKVDAACVLLFDPSRETLRFAAAKGAGNARLHRSDLRLGEGIAGRAALERRRIVVNDAEAFEREFVRRDLIDGEGFRAYLATPLVARGQLQGILELYDRTGLDLGDDRLDFLSTLATQAAIALDNATMVRSLERSNQELRLAYDATIEGWARALDLRDAETVGHSRRVTELTMRLAERMGLPAEERVHVRWGALLHDIGKMGVPDAILLKPGKLDPDEWELMKAHTTHGRDFLAGIDFLEPAIDIPWAHHERWDGTGYPRGLAGTEIPFAARVFAVVDVYDALTNDRPYRAAWSEARALAHIRQGAGSHFDPAVVDAFLAMIGAEDAGDPVSDSASDGASGGGPSGPG